LAKKVPDAPPAPDPAATAAGQTNANVQSAIANTIMGNANERSNLGSVTYNQIGTQQIKDAQGNPIDVPRYERVQTLSPEQQGLYDQQTKLGGDMNNLAISQIGRASGVLNTPFSTAGLPAAGRLASSPNLAYSYDNGGAIQKSIGLSQGPTSFGQTNDQVQASVGPNDFSKDRQKVEDALYSRIEPQLERDRSALDSRLRNQGFSSDSEAYRRAMDQSGRNATDARMQAVAAGGQEQSRLFGMDLSKGQFNNQAQQQEYDQLAGRGLFALQGTQQNNDAISTAANFANTAQAQANGQNRDAAMFYNQAGQQDFSNSAERANFDNTTRERALQERLTERNQPLNEISSLMSGGQVSMPTFTQYRPGNISDTPYASSVYSSANMTQDAWKNQQQMEAQNRAGLYSLAGSALGVGGNLAGRGLFPSSYGGR
jgi:hypothetical protein